MGKSKFQGNVLTREQMKNVGGGVLKVDDCTCIAPNNPLLCIFAGACQYNADNGTCTTYLKAPVI